MLLSLSKQFGVVEFARANYDELLCLHQKGSFIQKYTFKLPYCYSCYQKIRKSKLFKDRERAVAVSNVLTKKYGKFLRKEGVNYVEFDFKNEQYGQLFKEANKELLLETYLAKVQKQ